MLPKSKPEADHASGLPYLYVHTDVLSTVSVFNILTLHIVGFVLRRSLPVFSILFMEMSVFSAFINCGDIHFFCFIYDKLPTA